MSSHSTHALLPGHLPQPGCLPALSSPASRNRHNHSPTALKHSPLSPNSTPTSIPKLQHLALRDPVSAQATTASKPGSPARTSLYLDRENPYDPGERRVSDTIPRPHIAHPHTRTTQNHNGRSNRTPRQPKPSPSRIASKNDASRDAFIRMWTTEHSFADETGLPDDHNNNDASSTTSSAASGFSMALTWSYDSSTAALYRPLELGFGRKRPYFPREPMISVQSVIVAVPGAAATSKKDRFNAHAANAGVATMRIDLPALESKYAAIQPENAPLHPDNLSFDIVLFGEERMFYDTRILTDSESVHVAEWLAIALEPHDLKDVATTLDEEFDHIALAFKHTCDMRRRPTVMFDSAALKQLDTHENNLRFKYIAVEQRMKCIAQAIVLQVTERAASQAQPSKPLTTLMDYHDNDIGYTIAGATDDNEAIAEAVDDKGCSTDQHQQQQQ